MDIDENEEEYGKHPHCCAYCLRVYQWSADDLAWKYKQPFMPCGHPWLYRRDMEDDPRIFQVTTFSGSGSGETICYDYVLSDLKRAYPMVYKIVKWFPRLTHLRVVSKPTSIEVSVRFLKHKPEPITTSQSPFDEPPDDR